MSPPFPGTLPISPPALPALPAIPSSGSRTRPCSPLRRARGRRQSLAGQRCPRPHRGGRRQQEGWHVAQPDAGFPARQLLTLPTAKSCRAELAWADARVMATYDPTQSPGATASRLRAPSTNWPAARPLPLRGGPGSSRPAGPGRCRRRGCPPAPAPRPGLRQWRDGWRPRSGSSRPVPIRCEEAASSSSCGGSRPPLVGRGRVLNGGQASARASRVPSEPIGIHRPAARRALGAGRVGGVPASSGCDP